MNAMNSHPSVIPRQPCAVSLVGAPDAWRQHLTLICFRRVYFGRRVSLCLTSSSQRYSPAASWAAISSTACLSAWCMMLAATFSAGVSGGSDSARTSISSLPFRSVIVAAKAIMRRAGWVAQVVVSTEAAA